MSRSEIRDRPQIRQVITELHYRHPRTAGVKDLFTLATVQRPA
ncbi:hypothetical protein ACFWBH_00980 [Streptomyces sp. NPDC059999]